MSKSDFFNHYQMMYRLHTNPLEIPFYIEKTKRKSVSKKSRKARKSVSKKSRKARKSVYKNQQ